MSDIEREAFGRIERHFNSGNEVGIEQSVITRADWSLAKGHIKAQAQAVSVPEGYALVPARMTLDLKAMELLLCMTGEGFTEDEFSECVLWVGATVDDDGKEDAYGLQVACNECLQEGSVTVIEFEKPATPTKAESPVAEVAEGPVLRWRTPYNRPPVGTKLYAQTPTNADELIPQTGLKSAGIIDLYDDEEPGCKEVVKHGLLLEFASRSSMAEAFDRGICRFSFNFEPPKEQDDE